MALINGDRRDNVNFASLLSVPCHRYPCVAAPKLISVKVVVLTMFERGDDLASSVLGGTAADRVDRFGQFSFATDAATFASEVAAVFPIGRLARQSSRTQWSREA